MAALTFCTVAVLSLLMQLVASQSSCGVPVVDPEVNFTPSSTRIRGGEEAVPHSWPWQIRLGYKMGMSGAFVCGGTILDRYHVLTASHCFIGAPAYVSFFVRVGDHSMLVNEIGQKDYDVAQLIRHPLFSVDDFTGLENDIAILRLKKPITFSSTVSAACLPQNGSDAGVERSCVVTGWGSTVNQTTGVFRAPSAAPIIRPSNVLKQAHVSVLDRDACQQIWDPLPIKDHMICSIKETLTDEPCQGDSGGPLVCLAEGSTNTWIVEGVVSFGAGCGQGGPAVFTRVGSFVKWIQGVLEL